VRRLTVALACAALAFAPGCGGDDGEADEPPSAPVPTVPEAGAPTDSEPAPGPVDEAPAAPEAAPGPPAPAPEPDPGGAVAPAEPEPPVDSPENDVPPPPGSEAEEFEEFCDANPGACG